MNFSGKAKKSGKVLGTFPARDRARTQGAAVTFVTVIVLSFSVPVTVTLAPALLSRVARAALSLASRV